MAEIVELVCLNSRLFLALSKPKAESRKPKAESPKPEA